MADPPPAPDSSSETRYDTRVRPGRGSPPSTPRWVKGFGIIVIVLVLLFVILHLTSRGFGGHTSSGGLGGHTPPSSATQHGLQQP